MKSYKVGVTMRIYYFSGTGNSLAISRKLSELLVGDCKIVSISVFENTETIDVEEEAIGFVFPVYFETLPDVVKLFVKKLNFKTHPYIFGVATCNGVPGHSLFSLSKYLNIKGESLSSGFVIDMPGNALITPQEVEVQRLKESKLKIAEIAQYINSRSTKEIEGDNGFRRHVESFVVGNIAKKLQFASKRYYSTSDCIHCSICKKVCPVNNIEIVDKKPKWGNNCAACLACFHWCPKKAIVINGMISKRHQYHHPEISVKDIELKNSSLF